MYVKLSEIVVSADEVRLPADWDEPLTTCPKWLLKYTTYFQVEPISPAMGSAPLLTIFFNFSFSSTPEVVMFIEDHYQPRIVELIQDCLLTLVFSNYIYFADELSSDTDYASLEGLTRQNLYHQLERYNIQRFMVDDSYHRSFVEQTYRYHDAQNVREQRDLVMAMRYLTILAKGNGKLFTLNGYFHLGIARHLLAFGCKVLVISENTQISSKDSYHDFLIMSKNRLVKNLLSQYQSSFTHVELPLLALSKEQQYIIVLNITKLIMSKPFAHKQKYISNFGFFHGPKSLENKINEPVWENNNVPY